MAPILWGGYCPSCSLSVVRSSRSEANAIRACEDHARITGHVVHLVDAGTWSVIDTIAGEPSLPLWEPPASA